MMNATPSSANQRVEQCVEILCLKGCRAIHGVIAQLERGESLPETIHLTEQERHAVLTEVKAIMAVYQRCTL